MKPKLLFSIALAAIFCVCGNSVQAQVTATDLPPGIQDVIKLTRAGMTEEVILAQLKSAGLTYKLTPDQLIYIGNQGVSQKVLQALILHETSAAAAASTPAAIPPSGAPPAWASVLSPLTFDHLHDVLAPYGTWVKVDPYGLCWRPTAATADPNWHPYTQQGRWMYTEVGWFWHSDYSWGDTVFHFGRWLRDKGTWVWVPGNAWAPAWVTWRLADGYLGWAPLPPTVVFKSGTGLEFNDGPAGDSAFGLRPEAFTFVPCDRFWDRDLAAAMVPAGTAAEVFKTSAVRNGYHSVKGVFAVEGVGRDRVAALTHHEITIETPSPPLSSTIWRDGASTKGTPTRP